MGDLVLAPYLPLSEKAEIGPWALLPFRDFASRNARGRALYNQARRIITAYRLKDAMSPIGCVAVPIEGRAGDECDPEHMRVLARALAGAVVDGNPSLVHSDDSNLGHRMATADNALVVGHLLDGGPRYAVREGALVARLDLRYAPPGRRLPPVTPPPGLPTPMLGAGLDTEYADALYAVIASDTTAGRRLDRTIQWLVLAWTNATVVGEDARIVAFRAAFEVLLGASETKALGPMLSDLLAPDSTTHPREWLDHGKARHGELTDVAWWFQSLSLLRNAISHGQPISSEQWLFDGGERHLWYAADYLRKAIKRTVVQEGHDPELEMDTPMRHLRRAYRELYPEQEPEN